MPVLQNSLATYPTWMGFIYVFNLIVGTGALTLPAAFAGAGYLLSLIVLVLIAFISFVTVTYVIEALSCANAVETWKNFQIHIADINDDLSELLLPENSIENDSYPPLRDLNQSNMSDSEELVAQTNNDQSICLFYNLNKKFELGEIATLFFNDIGRMIVYLCIAIYLYGDLCIYCAVIAKSLCDIVCDSIEDFVIPNINIYTAFTVNTDNMNDTALCSAHHVITRLSVYRLFLIGFVVLFGPFAAFSVQKTKYVQIFTIIFRFLAFSFMIGLAIKIILSNPVKIKRPIANYLGLPTLFGAGVYSFMCHHSLPSLLAPIRHKSKLRAILTFDFIIIAIFYIILALTGIFAFAHIQNLYTLNFIPYIIDNDHTFLGNFLTIINYFLGLFPVFTLSASFPIIAITLRNNLQILFLDMTRFETYSFFVRRILFPLCTILPPFAISYFTKDVASLVTITGSYAGVCIQYLVPVFLVYYARRTCKDLIGDGITNRFRSPFQNFKWLIFVLIWSATSVLLVTINLCIK